MGWNKRGTLGILILVGILLTLPIVLGNIDSNSNLTITDGLFENVVANASLHEYNFTIIVNQNFTKLNITVNGNYTTVPAEGNRTNNTLVDFSNTTDGTFSSFVWQNNSAGGTSGGNFLINSTSQTATEADNNQITWTASIMFTNGSTVTQNFVTVIDSLAPRVHVVNATDGNTTLWNRTSTGQGKFNDRDILGEVSGGGGGNLGGEDGAAHIINTEIEETHLRAVQMYSRCNNSDANATLNPGEFRDNQTQTPIQSSAARVVHVGNITSGCIAEAFGTGAAATWSYYVYDLVGNYVNQNDSSADEDPGRAYTYQVFTGAPNMTQVNITDGFGNTVSSRSNLAGGQTAYLRSGANLTVHIEAGGSLTTLSGFFTKLTSKPVNVSFFFTMNNTALKNDLYQGTLVLASNLSGTANGEGPTDYTGIITPSQVNTSLGNFMNFVAISNLTVIAGAKGVYKGSIGIDGGPPVASATISKTSGRPSDKFTFTCGGTDLISGVANCQTTLTKPDMTTVSVTSTSCDDVILEGTNTSKLGAYTVECKLTDNVGITGTDTKTFTISSGGGGGGGGSSSGPTSTTDVDFTIEESATVNAKQGQVKTFTFGGTEHKMVFEMVLPDAVVLRIESSPKFVNVNLGDSKRVDINDDGIKDINIKVEQIVQGQAQVTITQLEVGARALLEEETGIRAEEETEETTEEEEEERPPQVQETEFNKMALYTWLITLGVVIIIIVGYIVVRKKGNGKKKKKKISS